MDRRLGLPRSFPHRLNSPRKTPDFNAAIAFGTAGANMSSGNIKTIQSDEKEHLHGLNDRLARFIEKVHQLESQNHLLEREIEEIKGRAKPAAYLEQEYGPELKNLRQLVQEISHQKSEIEIEHQNLEDELSLLKRQQEKETQSRLETENDISDLKREIQDAYQAKIQLDKKAQSLVDEIHFLKSDHEAEVNELLEHIQQGMHNNVQALEFGYPGLTEALRDIRAQLEDQAAPDLQQMGESFRSQFAKLTEAAEAKRGTLKATQQEIQEYRRKLQAKSVEMDCARGTREALEKQLHETEDRHKEELIHYQNTIKELENELINCKFDMSGYLREYQELLNVKMALDVEILSYRKLLCSEESRLSTVSDTPISLPHIYHQSPVYTLPCFSRPGAQPRRLEPQYKFVEEIITETTREIEMTEFEDSGSDGAEVGRDEQGCSKSEAGGSAEEDDHQDGGEGGGDQVSDRHEGQVEMGGGDENEGEEEGNDQAEVTLSDVPDEEKQDLKGEKEEKEKDTVQVETTDQNDVTAKEGDLKVRQSLGSSEETVSSSVSELKSAGETSARDGSVDVKTDEVKHLVSELGPDKNQSVVDPKMEESGDPQKADASSDGKSKEEKRAGDHTDPIKPKEANLDADSKKEEVRIQNVKEEKVESYTKETPTVQTGPNEGKVTMTAEKVVDNNQTQKQAVSEDLKKK